MDAGPENPQPLPWPIHTLDFEASSLDDGTYPIEIGVARWCSPDHPIEGWSALIRTPRDWELNGSWSSMSEKIHGIGRTELMTGILPTEVMARLNSIFGTRRAYCDGGTFDQHWLTMLQHSAKISATFDLGDIEDLMLRLDHAGHVRMQNWLRESPPLHRARPDAERLLKAIARGLRVTYGTVENIR